MFEINPVIFELSNGMRVVYARREAFVAHMGVMVLAGSRYELPHEQGLAHFIEHCIFKGTQKRKALDIFTDLDSVGGELNAYTNKEEICVHASFRKIHFEIASELLSDIIQNATFPEEELKKEKDVVLDELISYMDSPSDRIYDDFEAKLFDGNALGYNILGTKKSVRGFKPDDLRAYIERNFRPSNMVLSFVGNIPLDQVRDVFERDFGSIPVKEDQGNIPEIPVFKHFDLQETKSNFQTHTIIGGCAPSGNDLSRRAMTLLTNVLGGPALNARLTLSVREKYGYAYNVEANYTPYSDVGFWMIYLGTDKKYLEKAIALIQKELADLCANNLTEKECFLAKEQLKGHIALSLDSNIELMFSLAKTVLLYGKIDTMAEIYQQIDEIDLMELHDVAHKYIAPENLSRLVFTY